MTTAAAVLDVGKNKFYTTGWLKDPREVERVVSTAGIRPLSAVAPRLMTVYGDDESPRFFWRAEEQVLSRRLPTWNQGQVGSCVGFGWGRAVQDLILLEIVSGQPEHWPDHEVAPEAIYGGSRVEVGGGQISGDGSIGAWAAKFVKDWGILIRTVYDYPGGILDLTTYNERTCRRLGERPGIPDALEPMTREHPVTDVAGVYTTDELWTALGALKPVPVCSMQGFTTTRDSEGFCRPSGQWAHCMNYRGRFRHPRRGRCVVEANSWGDYLNGPDTFEYVDTDGTVKRETLPAGHFCVELRHTAQALAERDSYAIAGIHGWGVPTPPTPVPPIPPVPPTPTPPTPTIGFTGTARYVNGILVEFALPTALETELLNLSLPDLTAILDIMRALRDVAGSPEFDRLVAAIRKLIEEFRR